jgi:DeoR family suf operon transcriptional repressor
MRLMIVREALPWTPHKGLRGDILVELKRSQPLTARDLADRLAVSSNAIRHHLKELEAEQLVVYGREQRGVGAPTFAFRLSPQGEAQFPKRYEQALTDMLERVAETQGRSATVAMLEGEFAQLSRRVAAAVENAAPAERVAAVARALSEAGYMAEWDEREGRFRLAEHNCALRAVAERFPEICAAEEKFLQRVLSATVERRQHIVSGCNTCEYAITFDAPAARPDAGDAA